MLIQDFDTCYHMPPPYYRSSLIRYPRGDTETSNMVVICVVCWNEITKDDVVKENKQ